MLATPDNETIFRETLIPHDGSPAKTLYSDAEPLIAVRVITAEERLKRLRRHQKLFAIVLTLCIVALGVSIAENWAYEPALALLLAVAGIFVVFWMKVREAKG